MDKLELNRPGIFWMGLKYSKRPGQEEPHMDSCRSCGPLHDGNCVHEVPCRTIFGMESHLLWYLHFQHSPFHTLTLFGSFGSKETPLSHHFHSSRDSNLLQLGSKELTLKKLSFWSICQNIADHKSYSQRKSSFV